MADKKVTATKCGCGESTTELDYAQIPAKCEKCDQQIHVANTTDYSKQSWGKPAKKTKKAEGDN